MYESLVGSRATLIAQSFHLTQYSQVFTVWTLSTFFFLSLIKATVGW